VSAAGAGSDLDRLISVVRFPIDDGAAGLLVQALGPSDGHERLPGDELTRAPVDNVEESVFVACIRTLRCRP